MHPGFLLGAGKYKIVKLLGSGGFGNTYLAEHVLLGKRVAVKEFFASQFCNRDSDGTSVSLALTGKAGVVAKLRKKFMEEARALAGLNHPGIVRVSDVFEENGTAYYVMDLIEGKPLSAIVREKGSLGEKEAVGYIKQVCQALKVVHGKGRLHLDIKPANIMVDGDGHAVLIDFGASKQYDEGSGENTSTFVARTAGYAPLEQGSGSGIKTFSPSTDIYALGATLYKLLSGSTPPDAADLASGEELPPLPAVVSGRTKAAVGAAMSLRRGDRPQSVEEFEGLLSGVDSPGSVREEDERTEIAGVPSSKPRVPSSSSSSNSSSSSTIAGHEYVDLGLSVKWATCNVGASSPEGYGYHYAWGETSTSTKFSYKVENSKTYKKNYGDIAGISSLDAARAKWGSTWRLPTADEIDELIEKCNWKWTTMNGKNGYKVTSKVNGRFIFLPAAGCRFSSSLNLAGSSGYYWSSTPFSSGTYYAYSLDFHSGYVYRNFSYRHFGQSVRPVSE